MPGAGSSKGVQKPAKTTGTSTTGVNQGTATNGFDPNAATVSYITSSMPTAADPNNIERMTEAQLNSQLINMTPQERLVMAQKLKAAGYRVGPLTGAVTKALRQSWLNAHADLQTEIQAGQQLDLPTYLAVNAGAGGTAGTTPKSYTYQINDTDAVALINKVYRQIDKRDATPQEIARLTKDIRKFQAANPQRVTYSAGGSATYSGGGDVGSYLEQKLQKTGEAKMNRAEDAYSIMMEELGGLR